jgi:hypothetical protein
MLELVAILLLYVATVLHYGTTRLRGTVRFPALARPSRAALSRGAALVAVLGAGWLWSNGESSSAAVLVVLTGLMASLTVVTLLGPVAPRGLRLSAGIAAAAVPLILMCGGLR